MTTATFNETELAGRAEAAGATGDGALGRGLARALGFFSIGLGTAELVAPGAMGRLAGFDSRRPRTGLLRAFGLREIGSGIGILARPGAPMVGSRLVGDLIDAATLIAAMRGRRRRARALAALGVVAGVAAVDAYCTRRLRGAAGAAGAAGRTRPRRVEVREAITINRSPDEVYRFWRDFTNLPRFMSHLVSVDILDDGRSRWVARGPGGSRVEWEAQLIEDLPGRRIGWQPVGQGDVAPAGSVSFAPAPGGRGTELLVTLSYLAPGGRIGRAVARLFGEEPEQQIEDDLRALKQVMETGEVVHSDASIHRGPHPARPAVSPSLRDGGAR